MKIIAGIVALLIGLALVVGLGIVLVGSLVAADLKRAVRDNAESETILHVGI